MDVRADAGRAGGGDGYFAEKLPIPFFCIDFLLRRRAVLVLRARTRRRDRARTSTTRHRTIQRDITRARFARLPRRPTRGWLRSTSGQDGDDMTFFSSRRGGRAAPARRPALARRCSSRARAGAALRRPRQGAHARRRRRSCRRWSRTTSTSPWPICSPRPSSGATWLFQSGGSTGSPKVGYAPTGFYMAGVYEQWRPLDRDDVFVNGWGAGRMWGAHFLVAAFADLVRLPGHRARLGHQATSIGDWLEFFADREVTAFGGTPSVLRLWFAHARDDRLRSCPPCARCSGSARRGTSQLDDDMAAVAPDAQPLGHVRQHRDLGRRHQHPATAPPTPSTCCPSSWCTSATTSCWTSPRSTPTCSTRCCATRPATPGGS